MENIHEEKDYPTNLPEQDLSSIEPKTESIMSKKYATIQEKQIYRKLTILGITTFLILIVLFFWGLPILARLAGFLTFLPGRDEIKSSSDVIPPFPPRLEGIPIATNSAQIKLAGFAESGSTLEIFLNGALAQKLLIGSDGRFERENLNLTYGDNKIQLKSIDAAGNSSPAAEQQILFDNTPPELEIAEPTNGTVFFGQQNQIKISGKTDPGTTILANGFWAIVDQEGKFSLFYPSTPGENRLEITAQDTAGNQTKKSLTIYYNP